MSFLNKNCRLFAVKDPKDLVGFTCGDADLDEFFAKDSFAYTNQLLGKTYCYKLRDNSQKVVCAFTLANAGIRVSDLPNARKKKIESDIPHSKILKDYPAVLIARLGVSSDFKSHNIGSEALKYIKLWFLEPYNKTGCRFVIVDAYNMPHTLSFYQKNGFRLVFSSEQQEMNYRKIKAVSQLKTRLMYFDLLWMASGIL